MDEQEKRNQISRDFMYAFLFEAIIYISVFKKLYLYFVITLDKFYLI